MLRTKKIDRKLMESVGIYEGFDVGLEMSGVPMALRDMLDKE